MYLTINCYFIWEIILQHPNGSKWLESNIMKSASFFSIKKSDKMIYSDIREDASDFADLLIFKTKR